jgi:nucleotide-binding universal stress UspA family protein
MVKGTDARTRIQLKNVLFCTDFSPAAARALPYAADLVRHFGGKLYALHVRPPDQYLMVPAETWQVPAGGSEAAARERAKMLLGTIPGIEPEILIGEGEIWPAIASVIEEKQIDLAVIGTHGRTGIEKLVLGSAAEEIFRRASCAVLTVGPHSPSQPSHGEHITQILYATDFTPEAEAAAPYAISLAQEYQAHITLMHVIVTPRTGDLLKTSEVKASAERTLRTYVPSEAELWCEPGYVVEQGNAAAKILETADRIKADLILLGVRRPSTGMVTHLPIATAHKVVSQAKSPVLTVRR